MAVASENPNSSKVVFAKSGLFTSAYCLLIIFYSAYLHDTYNFCTPPLIAIFLAAELAKHLWISPQPKEEKTRTKDKPKEFLKCLTLILLMTTVYYILAVILGAPILEQQKETLLFALLMVTLTVVPFCLSFGYSATGVALLELTSRNPDSKIGVFQRGACLVIFGAWLGAVVIPLDWDRPWQQWPIPCSAGAVFALLYDGILNTMCFLPKFNRVFSDKTGKYGL